MVCCSHHLVETGRVVADLALDRPACRRCGALYRSLDGACAWVAAHHRSGGLCRRNGGCGALAAARPWRDGWRGPALIRQPGALRLA